MFSICCESSSQLVCQPSTITSSSLRKIIVDPVSTDQLTLTTKVMDLSPPTTKRQPTTNSPLLKRLIELLWRMQNGTNASTRTQGSLHSFSSLPVPPLWCHQRRLLPLHWLCPLHLLVHPDALATGIGIRATGDQVVLWQLVGTVDPLTMLCRIVHTHEMKRRSVRTCSSIRCTASSVPWRAKLWFDTSMEKLTFGTQMVDDLALSGGLNRTPINW